MNRVPNDSVVVSLLAATLSNDALYFIFGSKSSKEIWCRLKEKCVDTSRDNIMKLKTSLYNIQKGSDSIDKIKILRSYVSMEELRSLLLIAEDEIDQTMKSLPSSLETVVAAFGDTSRGTAVISNTNALTDNSSKPVSQFGIVP
ncbi:hypothetical protein ACLB2K_022895 [Fragaria x ananassa]